MLEVRYIEVTKAITGWCNNIERFGRLAQREGETFTILDIEAPPKSCRAYLYDEVTEGLIDNPDYPRMKPPSSTHSAEIIGADLDAEKPLVVRRVWEGQNYDCACYVAEELVLLWRADKLHIGDTVLIEFMDEPLTPVAILKVHRTW